MSVNGPIDTNSLSTLAVTPEKEGLTVKNVFAGTLAVGTLVCVNGTTTDPATGGDVYATVTKADADANAPATLATYVVVKAMAQNAFGKVARSFTQYGVNTSSWGTVGDPVYLSTTAGEATATAPTSPGANVQRVGYVAKKSATAGIISFDLRSNTVTKFGTLNIGGVIGSTVAPIGGDQAAGAISAGNIGVPVRLSLVIPDGATGNVDFTGLPFKCRVREARVVKTTGAGGGSDTVRVANGATTNWITNAFDINVADQTVVRATAIDDAYYDLAVNATIRVARTKVSANNVACVVTLELDVVA
jgi:hypothetical protein